MEHTLNDSLIKGATPDIIYTRFSSGKWDSSSTSVPKEMALTIYIDSEELVTLLCTPVKLSQLVLGFLYSEGIITDKNDVASMRVCEEESLADVKLSKPGFKPPERRTLSSGCGAGVTFSPKRQPVESDLVVSPEDVLALMKQLNEQAELHRFCGGVHTSALGDTSKLLVVAEDIGRHNTLDKIMGECLMMELPTRDGLLLTTGRISSEMLSKATRMGTPVVISRSSPTDKSISLAQELGITLIGYVRGNRLSVYSHEQRVQGAPGQEH
ncbi:MAG TPA: formate dehydrogenase accessory sulfurtransferase FdhD [Dehalococcoidia bacterium]|nr:formate dehydrogenase accessory sulfurtransferase FdhD [Dehalococcoidia bacterium]